MWDVSSVLCTIEKGLAFPTVQDSAIFGTKGQKFLYCRTKGQQDKLKILPQDGMGRDSLSKSGTGRGTGQSLYLSKSGTGRGTHC